MRGTLRFAVLRFRPIFKRYCGEKIVGCGVAVNLNPTVCGILFSRMRYCGGKDLKWRFYGVDKSCGVRYFRLIVASPISRFQIEGSFFFALDFFFLDFGGVRYFNLFYAVFS